MAKFRVTMKDPDTLIDAVDEEAKRQVAALEGVTDDERQILIDKRSEALLELCDRWFQTGAYRYANERYHRECSNRRLRDVRLLAVPEDRIRWARSRSR